MHVAELRAVRLDASPADARSVHARPRYERPSRISSAIFRWGGQDRPNSGMTGWRGCLGSGGADGVASGTGGGMMEHAQQAGITIPPELTDPAAPPSAEQIIAFLRSITTQFLPLLAMTTAKHS